jgi:transposase
MNATTIAIDIAKNVFQLHWVDAETGVIHRRKLSRAKLAQFMALQRPARVVMEACGGAHHWARLFASMGHQVELLPPGQVRRFVRGNKDDAADARAIWLAAHDPQVRRVPLKSCEQQAIQSLHRLRAHWMSVRNASLNCLRGLLYEFGFVLPRGSAAALRQLAAQREEVDQRVPAMLVRSMQLHLEMIGQCETTISALEGELKLVLRQLPAAQRLLQIPGVGLLGATALAATLGDGRGWRNAREFAACLGMPPAHRGTGGKVRIGSMSKRGDPYLRTLVIAGARSVLRSANKSAWLQALLERRPLNVAIVAQAHKTARLAWALVAHARDYDPHWKPAPPKATLPSASAQPA